MTKEEDIPDWVGAQEFYDKYDPKEILGRWVCRILHFSSTEGSVLGTQLAVNILGNSKNIPLNKVQRQKQIQVRRQTTLFYYFKAENTKRTLCTRSASLVPGPLVTWNIISKKVAGH